MGSRAGCQNKNKEFLLNRLKDMYGKDFDPILKMAQNCLTLQTIADKCAKGMRAEDLDSKAVVDASSSAIDAIAAWDKVAQYVQPKLKAVELTGADGEALKITVMQYTGKSKGK